VAVGSSTVFWGAPRAEVAIFQKFPKRKDQKTRGFFFGLFLAPPRAEASSSGNGSVFAVAPSCTPLRCGSLGREKPRLTVEPHKPAGLAGRCGGDRQAPAAPFLNLLYVSWMGRYKKNLRLTGNLALLGPEVYRNGRCPFLLGRRQEAVGGEGRSRGRGEIWGRSGLDGYVQELPAKPAWGKSPAFWLNAWVGRKPGPGFTKLGGAKKDEGKNGNAPAHCFGDGAGVFHGVFGRMFLNLFVDPNRLGPIRDGTNCVLAKATAGGAAQI